MAIEAALAAMVKVCTDRTQAKTTMVGLCKLHKYLVEINPLERLYSKLLGDTIAQLLTAGPLHAAIQRCCDEMVSSQDQSPDWANQLDVLMQQKSNETPTPDENAGGIEI